MMIDCGDRHGLMVWVEPSFFFLDLGIGIGSIGVRLYICVYRECLGGSWRETNSNMVAYYYKSGVNK